jgi:hypothetical protein
VYYPILTHVADGLALLLQQYQGKRRIAGVLSTFLSQVQEIEDATFEVFRQSLDLDNAEGVRLDWIGALLVQARGPHGDDAYRKILKAKVRVIKSSGTIENILSIFACLTDGLVTLTWDSAGCIVVVLAEPILASDGPLFAGLLRLAREADARAILRYITHPLTACFVLGAPIGTTRCLGGRQEA